jgi:hypothetical protein
MLIPFVLSIIQTINHDRLTHTFEHTYDTMKRVEAILEKAETQLRSSAQTASQTNPPDGSNQNDNLWNDLKIAVETGSVVRKRLLCHSVDSIVHTNALNDGSNSSGNSRDYRPFGGTRSSSISSASSSRGRTEHMDDPKGFTVDRTPGFDDTTPQEVLKALVVGLRERVKFETGRSQDDLAAQHLSDAILHHEQLYICYGMEYDDFKKIQNEMKSQLNDIYIGQDKDEEAIKIIHRNLQPKSKPGGTILLQHSKMVGEGVLSDRAITRLRKFARSNIDSPASCYTWRLPNEKQSERLNAARKVVKPIRSASKTRSRYWFKHTRTKERWYMRTHIVPFIFRQKTTQHCPKSPWI